MVKITLNIDGMMCGMCEAHINDAIRRNFNVKKVTSSHKSGETVIISEKNIDQSKLEKAIAETGYELKGIYIEPYNKKKGGFLGLFKK